MHFRQQPPLPASASGLGIIKCAHDRKRIASDRLHTSPQRKQGKCVAIENEPLLALRACGYMTPRTIAIGDIHGCSAALRALIEAINPTTDDTLVLLGDYIDRGPDSRGVLDYCVELEQRCPLVPLLGNHELMMVNSLENMSVIGPWLQCGGDATVRSYDGRIQNIPQEHLAFIRRCRTFYEMPTHFFVHANYAPNVPLADQPDYLLFWEHLHAHQPAPHENGKIAIVGHTAQKNAHILNLGHLVCIDTFCHGGGWLTALEPATGQIWQADMLGRLRPDPPSI
jgi:serine/threonine protein phosphatase 1